ncbi:hypothetical protein ACL58G_04560 [Massilia sp. GER05]|uniref:hypothetical protein n=1 Tax=Massilia sp. GER05 TaxID=3394605 RepID=UPI003F83A6BC
MTTSTGAANSQTTPGTTSFTESVSAADTSIGFEYQYYYYLDRLINLRTGESAGLEVKDDVHTDLADGFCILVQLKHTVKTNAAGSPIALAELSLDLWKTLYNWARIITDDTQQRDTVPEQLKFIGNTEFHLVTNKSQSKTNKFLETVIEFQDSKKTFTELRDAIEKLSTTNATLQSYIQTVLDLDDDVLAAFFKNIRFELELDDIIARVKKSIREKFIDDEMVDSVFERLDSNIRSENFKNVKAGAKLQLTFEEFWTNYKKYFSDGRSKKLQYTKYQHPLPANLFAQTFVKRLLEIGAITQTDIDKVTTYTLAKLRLVTNLERWRQQGRIVSDDIEALHDEVITRWENEFDLAFAGCGTEQEIITAALEMLRELRRANFLLDGTQLPIELSNGELYHLSDLVQIGWHKDWRQK